MHQQLDDIYTCDGNILTKKLHNVAVRRMIMIVRLPDR